MFLVVVVSPISSASVTPVVELVVVDVEDKVVASSSKNISLVVVTGARDDVDEGAALEEVLTISLYSLKPPFRLIIFSESANDGDTLDKFSSFFSDIVVLLTVVVVDVVVVVGAVDVEELLGTSFPEINGRRIRRFLILSLLISGL